MKKLYTNPSFLRLGASKLGVIFIIGGILFALVVLAALLDDEEYSDTSFYDDGDSSWYDDDSDYDDDNEIWDTWNTNPRPKNSKKNQGFNKGRFKNEAELKAYVNKAASNIDEIWAEIFKKYNKKYRKPKISIFSDEVETGCGSASYEDGPFYCSEDEAIYLDLNFFVNMNEELETEDTGSFAIDFIIAHEFGHHIQNLIGDLDKYSTREEKLRNQGKEKKANLVSVQTELQADFYAGVWANWYDEKYDVISEKNVEDALNISIAVGDDALGEESRENFSHGSSEMRLVWVVRGMATGDVQYGNTYDYKSLKKLEEADMMLDDDEEDNKK